MDCAVSLHQAQLSGGKLCSALWLYLVSHVSLGAHSHLWAMLPVQESWWVPWRPLQRITHKEMGSDSHSLFSWDTVAGQAGGGSLFAFQKGTPIFKKSFTVLIRIEYTLQISHCNFTRITRDSTVIFTNKHRAHKSSVGREVTEAAVPGHPLCFKLLRVLCKLFVLLTASRGDRLIWAIRFLGKIKTLIRSSLSYS